MQNTFSENTRRHIRERQRKKRWKSVVTALACVVVICTTYALILPALTLTGDIICGEVEHIHSDECYGTALTCGLSESDAEGADGHVHTDSCYTKVPVCETEEHEHTSDCYSEPNGAVSDDALPVDDSDAGTLDSPIRTASENDIQTADADDTTESIAVGETKTVSVGAGETVKISFVPEITHEYLFYSSSASGTDPRGYLYDASGKQLKDDDDGAGNRQFKITSKLTAGQTYFCGAQWYNSSYTGDITIHLELGSTHSYSEDEQGEFVCVCGAVAPTSGTCGNNLTWSLDKETGTLSITGTGAMTDYSSSGNAPWAPLASYIKNVTIDEGATSIGRYAFQNCTSLEKVSFPTTLSSISLGAFQYCTSLETVSLPTTLTNLGTYAFAGCTSLAEIDLSQTGVTALIGTFGGCSSLKAVSLPTELTKIETGAFKGCYSLTEIDLSDTKVESIGSEAFSNCNPETITFPATLKSIGSYAFEYCSSLTGIDLSQTKVESIGSCAFRGGTALKTAEFPDTLKKLEREVFSGCSSLTKVDLSDTQITSIDVATFQKCKALEDISFPATLTSIEDYAFYDCESLTEVDLSGTAVTSIDRNAFYSCDVLASVAFPETLTSIENYAFYDCRVLTEADLSGTALTTIGWDTFNNCFLLRKVSLPETLTQINTRAFYNCRSLTDITIPKAVTSVGSNAFSYCDNLANLRLEAKNIEFSKSQTSTVSSLVVTVAESVDTLTADAVAALKNMGCTSIIFEKPQYLTAGDWQADFLPERLEGLPQSEYFIDEQGVFYRIDSETNTASVFYVPSGIETYEVPKELPAVDGKTEPIPVTGVDGDAFRDASDLTDLTFTSPETITELQDMAFYGAGNLESINGASTSAGVLATFTATDLKIGTMLFRNTKITDSTEQISGDSIVTEKDNLTLTISTEKGKYLDSAQSEDGTYLYYTGEAAKTTITVSNPDSSDDDSGTVVRVYFRFDDKSGNISYAPGTYTVVSTGGNQYTMNVVKTNRDGCYYVEMEKPQKGDTISLIVESVYPSPTSSGGDAIVWCTVLTGEEKDSIGTGLTVVDKYQKINWSTVADTFPISKKEKTAGSSELRGSGDGSAYISGLRYTVAMSRDGTTIEGVGKDYMTSADFEDVFTLPQGVVLADDVLESIQNDTVKVTKKSGYNGGYYFATADGRTFLELDSGNNDSRYFQNGSVSLNDDGNLVIRWSYVNSNLSTEIADITYNYTIKPDTLIVPEPEADKVYTLLNTVTAKEHFMYSADQTQQDECSADVKIASSDLVVEKLAVTNNYSFGAERTYSITASNPGALPYERLAYMTDNLPYCLYMRPADLAMAFAEDPEHQLTVTIVYATLCGANSGKTVSGIDGSTVNTTVQNSGSDTSYSGMSNTDPDTDGYEASTITISWKEDGKLQIAVNNGGTYSCEAEESAIESVLESIGLVVTPNTQYSLKWDLHNADGTLPTLAGGGSIAKNVYCANKDSFMLLNNDVKYQYSSNSLWGYNYAYGRDSDGKSIDNDSAYVFLTREFNLTKNWSMNGKAIETETTIRDGDILDYELSISHSGTGQYDALPLVDHMSGTQALLVPAEKNMGADWTAGLNTVTDNGTEYYILSTPGTYSHVWTSENQLADSVEVTKSTSGLNTLIKWYFVNYTGGRMDTVAYRSYVCPNETADGALAYSLDNESWLNDHQSHRLYAPLPGWVGTSFDFDKKIVDSVGDTESGSNYSLVSEGETVVYRLELSSNVDKDGNEQTITITGSDMYDALPMSIEGYRWSGENVRITYADGCTVTNGNNWSIAEPEAGNQQYIHWSDDFSITFSGKAYIYVELTFPSDISWQEYAAEYGTTKLINTFRVLSAERSVTHEVSATAKVYLRKGVYDTGYYYGSNGKRYQTDMSTQDDRLYYQNNDSKTRAVKYYVALYNEGPTNLYLTEMQDLLPNGFTYGGGGRTNYDPYYGTYSFNTYTGNGTDTVQVMKGNAVGASKKSAMVTPKVKTTEDGRQIVTFHFSESLDTTYKISYDEERDMCYLKPGEAITFWYVCFTNEAQDTDDAALNTVTMPYYDFNNGGVNVTDSCTVTAPNSDQHTPNNGGCDVLDNSQAENLGFIGGTNDTQWLRSDVTLTRGGIKPGITKALTSKTDNNGNTTQNPVSASSSDTLNWSITAENDGTNSIMDYVLTDRMQSPYMFTGTVSYMIYNDYAGENLVAYPNYDYLFKISEGTDENHLSLRTNKGYTEELTVGGDSVTVTCGWYYNSAKGANGIFEDKKVQVSIDKDADGYAIMSLYFPDATMAIPEGGKGVLALSTYNTTKILENKQYINTCFITPMSQTWDNTTNKGNVTTLKTPYGEGERSTVRNSAPVTTSYGYVTGSSKSITEAGNETNTASCADEKNYIVLADKTKKFTYTLTVSNSTPKAIDKFILIDSLPETGDHTVFLASDERFSEFKVSLTEEPNFTVTVTDENGTVTTLDATGYTIEYSTATEFTAEDWKGTSTWNASAENARSIRLVINDSTGTLITAGSKLSLSFTCEIDDPNVQPGQIAWNSFGYHYRLLGEVAELEAAPLKVGVKTPGVPELRKQVVDRSGQARTADEDETFSFIVYPGTALTGKYTTREEWIAALGDTPYEEFSVTVKAGESISDSVRMDTTEWEWTDGQRYTVIELPCGEDFAFKRFTGSAGNSGTFTYASAQTQIITCENTALRWSIELIKENTSQEPLSGAIFALYSPDSADGLSAAPEGYENLNISLQTEYSNKTWYLTDVKTTPDDGKLTWSDLMKEEYYLLEVKAPDGYNLNSPAGQVLKQENETKGICSVTVVNRAGYSLPETGGTGTHMYTLGGLLLLIGAGILLLHRHHRRGKEDKASL